DGAPFRITGASIRFRSAGHSTAPTVDDVLALEVDGGQLQLPALPEPIALPSLAIGTAGTFTRTVTVPAIDLGPSFRTTQTARFTLTVTRQRAALELQPTSRPAMVALAGSANMKLTSLQIDTSGTFDGSVT